MPFGQINPTPHVALHCYAGAVGHTFEGIIDDVTRPLADKGISIFFVSTAVTDLVLVTLEDAVTAIESMPFCIPFLLCVGGRREGVPI